jgi:hypothetical protein
MILSELTNMSHINLAERSSPHESYLGCISWSISKPLTECEVFDRDADTFTPVTKEQLKTVVLTAEPCSTCTCCSGIKVQLPVHRSLFTDDLFETVTFAGPTVTAGQLLRRIHHFHNVRKLKRADLKRIAKMPEDSYRDAVLEASRSGGCRWIDMMGGLVFFQSLRKQHTSTYSLFLGS